MFLVLLFCAFCHSIRNQSKDENTRSWDLLSWTFKSEPGCLLDTRQKSFTKKTNSTWIWVHFYLYNSWGYKESEDNVVNTDGLKETVQAERDDDGATTPVETALESGSVYTVTYCFRSFRISYTSRADDDDDDDDDGQWYMGFCSSLLLKGFWTFDQKQTFLQRSASVLPAAAGRKQIK